MKRRIALLSTLLLAALFGGAPVRAEQHDEGSKGTEGRDFIIHGEVRTRWEYLSNYNDLDDDVDDDASFFPFRVRIAARGNFTDNVIGHVELQNFGTFGNDSSVSESESNDPVGQTFPAAIDLTEVHLYQGFLELRDIWDSKWSLRVGRSEHTLGTELHMGDADFYNGNAFDGIRAMWDTERFDLDLFHYVLDEFDDFALIIGAPAGDEDISFSGATLTWMIGDDQKVEPYVLYLRDGDINGPKFYTVGARYGRDVATMADVEENPFDWNAEFAMQSGDFAPNAADLSIGGTIFEGWFGYNWGGDNSRSRVHIGALIASGDDDSGDGDFDAFIPLFPDDHNYNRLGDLDLFAGTNNTIGGFTGGMSNISDINLGWTWFGAKQRLMVAGHWLTLTEDEGLPDDEIGQELDVIYNYQYSDHLGFEAGVGNLFAGDALETTKVPVPPPGGPVSVSADDIMRAWWQLRLRW